MFHDQLLVGCDRLGYCKPPFQHWLARFGLHHRAGSADGCFSTWFGRRHRQPKLLHHASVVPLDAGQRKPPSGCRALPGARAIAGHVARQQHLPICQHHQPGPAVLPLDSAPLCAAPAQQVLRLRMQGLFRPSALIEWPHGVPRQHAPHHHQPQRLSILGLSIRRADNHLDDLHRLLREAAPPPARPTPQVDPRSGGSGLAGVPIWRRPRGRVVELDACSLLARRTLLPWLTWGWGLIEDQIGAQARDKMDRHTWQLWDDAQEIGNAILAVADGDHGLRAGLRQPRHVGQRGADRRAARPDPFDIQGGQPGAAGIHQLHEEVVAMAVLPRVVGAHVAFAFGHGAGSGAGCPLGEPGMVDQHDPTARHTVGTDGQGCLCEQWAQHVQVDSASVHRIVERGPMALHHQAQFRRAVRARHLRHRVDDLEQRRRAVGERLIQLLSELRQAFECLHTRESARSSVVWQASLF
jgi:hypothetical protein